MKWEQMLHEGEWQNGSDRKSYESFTAWLFESWTALYKTGLNLEEYQWWMYRMIYHSGLYLQASGNQKELQNQSQRKPCFRCNPQPIDFDCGPSTSFNVWYDFERELSTLLWHAAWTVPESCHSRCSIEVSCQSLGFYRYRICFMGGLTNTCTCYSYEAAGSRHQKNGRGQDPMESCPSKNSLGSWVWKVHKITVNRSER